MLNDKDRPRIYQGTLRVSLTRIMVVEQTRILVLRSSRVMFGSTSLIQSHVDSRNGIGSRGGETRVKQRFIAPIWGSALPL